MGFLKNFSEPFAFALALWPFVSMLLTVPVLALLYHRDNRIRLSSAIVAYGTVLYLLGLLCFTLYPMPDDPEAFCAANAGRCGSLLRRAPSDATAQSIAVHR